MSIPTWCARCRRTCWRKSSPASRSGASDMPRTSRAAWLPDRGRGGVHHRLDAVDQWRAAHVLSRRTRPTLPSQRLRRHHCAHKEGRPMNAPRNTQYRHHRDTADRRIGRRHRGRRRSVRGPAGRCAGGNPRRAARQLRDLLPRPETDAGTAAALRAALGRDPSASVHAGHGRLSGDPRDHQGARGQEEFRRLMAHRPDVLAAAGDGHDAVRAARSRQPAATRCSPTSTSRTKACPTA